MDGEGAAVLDGRDLPGRIHVVGTSGAGKTTLAMQLAAELRVAHVQLDALYWGRDWSRPDLVDFRDRVTRIVSSGQWVVDGSHRAAMGAVFDRAELIVWLDYPITTILKRMLRRTFRRLRHRETLFSGNRETLGRVLSRRSPVLWTIRSHAALRTTISELYATHAGLRMVRLRSPEETARWLQQVSRHPPPPPHIW